ncbi:MAG: Fic/DOC family N-terminal domain-containing protein [Flavobacteriaceae bacterium]
MDFTNSVQYHYEKFPPQNLDYGKIVNSLLKATDALARYDQMLKNMHNSKILLAPLRNQEAVISSRMEVTICRRYSCHTRPCFHRRPFDQWVSL